jgi:hypothetical protein
MKLSGPRIRFGLDGEGKNICLCRESNPVRPARGLVATVTELPQSLTENCFFCFLSVSRHTDRY